MIILHACIRRSLGTKRSRELRLKNFLPAVIYGKKKSVTLITLNQNDLISLFYEINLKKKVLLIFLENKKINVLIQDFQRHPFKNKFLHIDFLRI